MTVVDSDALQFSLTDRGVGVLTLNRPEIHNAFDDQLIKDLTDFFLKANDDPAVQVVILTGAGKSFCAGADLNWMKKMVNYTNEENLEDSKKLAEMLHVMNNFSKPLIGKVNGTVMGGGVGLVSVCDHVIAAENVTFALSEVRLGILPAVISPYVIAKIGETHARSTFLSGHRFKTEKAYQIGLVHEVVSKEELDEAVNNYIYDMLFAGPNARNLAKELIRKVVDYGNDDNTKKNYTCELIAKVRTSEEGQDGMSALLEKRTPGWANNE